MPNDPTIEVIDNSDLDLSAVPMSDPVVDKQWVKAHIVDLYWELIPTKAGGKGKQLTIHIATDDVATSTDGRTVPPGHKARGTIWATPSGGLTQDIIDKKVKRFQCAALGLADLAPGQKFGANEQYIGKALKAYLVAEPGFKDPSMLFQDVGRWDKA